MNKAEILREDIENLVKKSLKDKNLKDEITFPLSEKTIKKIFEKTKMRADGYSCTIHSDDIRHIKNEHPGDIELIADIPVYLEKFISVSKDFSLDRNINKKTPCLNFRKRTKDNEVRFIKIIIGQKKVLRLKTLFRER